MIIKVTRSSADSYWYRDFIGDVFLVTGSDGDSYVVQHRGTRTDFLVERKDCRPIKVAVRSASANKRKRKPAKVRSASAVR